MKRLILCALLGSLSCAASAQSDPEASVFIRGYQIELPAKPVHLFAGDLQQYQGSYDLATGEPMSLRYVGNRLMATVGNQEPKLLVAAARNEFVSTDRQMRVALKRQDDGEYGGQVWLVGRSRTASNNKAGKRATQYAQLVSFR
ncbi:hypothetical protein [Massilia sp. CF038]|uniref:hypothetical protein n=1 Tax=Massilia sp. CF038 TaxID=1881045 RepID=UPI0009164706|nr:hypothetical protein [Massilia sp. CF038]SHH54766.1 hypothetical protein SAMN05428948_4399 [Massilia sp. CF038]